MRIILTLSATLLLAGACSKAEDKLLPAPAAPETPAVVEPEEAPLTPEEQLARKIEARENQPEPELNPDEPREKFQLVWVKGKEVLRSAQDSRYNLFLQMKGQKLTDKAYAAIFSEMLKQVEDFAIGQSQPELERAAKDICEVTAKLKEGARALSEEPTKALAELDVEIAALEKAQEEGKTVTQRTWDKLEAKRKEISQPILAGRFVLLAARQILDEALVLAEWGPRRAQLVLRDCMIAIAEDGGLALDLAQASLDKLIARAKWYRELE